MPARSIWFTAFAVVLLAVASAHAGERTAGNETGQRPPADRPVQINVQRADYRTDAIVDGHGYSFRVVRTLNVQ